MFWFFRKNKKEKKEEGLFSIEIKPSQAEEIQKWKRSHSCNTKTVYKRKIWIRQETIKNNKITIVKCNACSRTTHIL